MKKLTFLVYHKEYEDFLNSLRELGVVHIVEKQQGAAENVELQDNIRLSARLAAALKLLQNQKHREGCGHCWPNGGSAERGLQVLDEIDGLQAEHSKLLQQQQTCGKEKDALEAWGNFEPEGIQRLKDAGYVVGFYTCSEGQLQGRMGSGIQRYDHLPHILKSLFHHRDQGRGGSRSGCRAS